MSHNKEREEKICLNCGTTPLIDRYCQHCGQENVEPKQTLWHLIAHVFSDITHFDGKFFATMKMLLLRPGYLSSAYLRGQRTSYLDPIRMYLFISTFFFVFAHYSDSGNSIEMDRVSLLHDKEHVHVIDSMRIALQADEFNFESHSVPGDNKQVAILNAPYKLRHGVKSYDSLVKTGAEKVSWFRRWKRRQLAAVYEAYNADPYNFFPEVTARFSSSLSKIFFISLPLFAFILLLLNIRHRKQYYYVSHSIFSLHYYSVAFIFMVPYVAINAIYFDYDFVQWIQLAIFIGIFVYLWVAMKRFYKQGWLKTTIKFLFLSISTFILILVIAVGLFLSAFISMAGTTH